MERDSSQMLEAFRRQGAIAPEDDVAEGFLAQVAPEFAGPDVLRKLDFQLRDALLQGGVQRLYQHQAEAIALAMDGHNVVLQSPTASGKTLSFQLPMLHTLIREPNARALMIYPTKALAKDQEDQLISLTQRLAASKITIRAFDGDTPKNVRPEIKSNPPHILRTNPDMLHHSFLAWGDQWEYFFKNLRWVIVDEIHEYRGYFGSNVALVLRRLSHHLKTRYNVEPQYFLSSATCANPAEHAKELTGLDFHEVGRDTEMRPNRRYWAVQLNLPDAGYWDQLRERAVDAALASLQEDKSVLVFCPTRIFAEDCQRMAAGRLEEMHEQDRNAPSPDVIKVYRGGLGVKERAEIQDSMQSGKVKVVFATNALEIGIDVGGLDGVILVGFPNNMMSARQQIGRAGRNWKDDAFVLYFPRNNPLDRYYASNVGEFYNRPLDRLVANHNNAVLVERHLPCVLSETGTVKGGLAILGETLYNQGMQKEGRFAGRRGRPHQRVDIRGGGSDNYDVKDGRDRIGTMSGYQRFREAYDDAIYFHGGKAYRVEDVITKRSGPGEVRVRPVEPNERHLRTNPKISASLSREEPANGLRWRKGENGILILYGEVTVVERMHSIEEVDERNFERRNVWQPSDNAAYYLDAEACWLDFEGAITSEPGAVAALQQMLRVGTLLSVPADEHDVIAHVEGRGGRAYVVESFEGGIGIASDVFAHWREILREGMKVAEECAACITSNDDGCPNCIVPPRINVKPRKAAGLNLARELLSAAEGPHADVYVNSFWEPSGKE